MEFRWKQNPKIFILFALWWINENIWVQRRGYGKRMQGKKFLNSLSLRGYACACNRISKQIPASSHLVFVYFPRFLSLVIASYIMHINSSYLWSTDVCFMFWKKNQETLFCFEELPREPEAHKTALRSRTGHRFETCKIASFAKTSYCVASHRECHCQKLDFAQTRLEWCKISEFSTQKMNRVEKMFKLMYNVVRRSMAFKRNLKDVQLKNVKCKKLLKAFSWKSFQQQSFFRINEVNKV